VCILVDNNPYQESLTILTFFKPSFRVEIFKRLGLGLMWKPQKWPLLNTSGETSVATARLKAGSTHVAKPADLSHFSLAEAVCLYSTRIWEFKLA